MIVRTIYNCQLTAAEKLIDQAAVGRLPNTNILDHKAVLQNLQQVTRRRLAKQTKAKRCFGNQ